MISPIAFTQNMPPFTILQCRCVGLLHGMGCAPVARRPHMATVSWDGGRTRAAGGVASQFV